MVSPSRFIPLAEGSGLIVQMGEWALRQACVQAATWHRLGLPSLRVSVNVSAAPFRRADWVDTVRRTLVDSQLDPSAFVREIGLKPAEEHEEAPIIRTIIALAHNLGMSVVAEGVETQVQRRLLLELGCESLQGFLLYRPMDVAAIEAVLLGTRNSVTPGG